MEYLAMVLIGFVAFEHFYFLVLEMFLWTKPKTIKIFGIRDKQLAEDTKVLAANQGLYNGFLSAGLIISLILEDSTMSIVFLSFVIVAGTYGAYSTKKLRLFLVQGVPAILALAILFLTL
jgi:putative membrane protein